MKREMLRELEKKEYRNLAIFYIIMVCINMIVVFHIKLPAVIPDEINTLAMPAYISGHKWNLVSELYYGWGGGILYSPLFLLVKDSVILYKSIIFINVLVISIIPILAYIISRRFLSIEDKKIAALLAILIGLYPGNVSLSHYAWNETWVRIIPWLVVLVLLRLSDGYGKRKFSLILGFLCVYAYSIHGRLIVIFPIICFMYLLIYLRDRKILFDIKYFLLSAAVMFYIDKILKRYFQHALFGENVSLPNTLSHTITKLILSFSEKSTILNILRATSSYFFYVVITSFGLMIISVVFLYKNYFNSTKMRGGYEQYNINLCGIFAVLGVLSSVIISVLFFSSDLERYKIYIYGRYSDTFTPLILLYSLIMIYKIGIKRNVVIVSGAIIFLHMLQIAIVESKGIENIIIVDVNTSVLMSLVPNYRFESGYIFSGVLMLLYAVTVFCFYSLKNRYKFALLVYAVVYLISNIHLGYRRIQKSDYSYDIAGKEYETINRILLEKNISSIEGVGIVQHRFQQEYLMLFHGIDVFHGTSFYKSGFFELNLEKTDETRLEKGRFQLLDETQKPLKLYTRDENIVRELKEKEISMKECDVLTLKRNRLYSNKMQSWFRLSGNIIDGGYMYGPYIKLLKGRYKVTVYGEGLSTEQKDVRVYGKEEDSGEFVDMNINNMKVSDGELVCTFELSEDLYDFEIFIHNLSSENIRIDSIQIRILD